MNSLVFHLSGAYAEQGFLPWLEKEAQGTEILDLTALEGCCCYCDGQASDALFAAFPSALPALRWLDSGDYHYLSHLLALREKQPFHLVLLDNHPDNQEPAFEGVLSCGSWVKEMKEQNPQLRDVLTIGPEGCEADIPAHWLEQRRGERVYVSLDKDIMGPNWARTDWSQGTYSLEQVQQMLRRIFEQMEVVAVDICGELAPGKGATPEDLRINKETNIALYKFLTHFLNQHNMSEVQIPEERLQRTCLYGSHLALEAKMSPFAGFMMPIQYAGAGITVEHNAVRQNVGMFDVSHMGEIFVEGPEAEAFVNHIFTNDIRGMEPGKVLYGMMCYPNGGTVDDLLVYKEFEPEHYLLVVNAANIDKDFAWIQEHVKGFNCKVENASAAWGQIALQGPKAEETLIKVLGYTEAAKLGFYEFCDVLYKGQRLILSRTGYTGEDGFEIYTTPAGTVEIWNCFLQAGVQPCGLGCRDTLRFEAGLPLYGDELSQDISPVMAGLGMFCKYEKDFIGKEALLDQKAGNLTKKLVGIEIEDKAIPRAGYPVETADEKEVGVVTTGYHSISLDKSICFALVNKEYAALDTPLNIRIRKKVFPGKVVKKRFYQTNYKK